MVESSVLQNTSHLDPLAHSPQYQVCLLKEGRKEVTKNNWWKLNWCHSENIDSGLLWFSSKSEGARTCTDMRCHFVTQNKKKVGRIWFEKIWGDTQLFVYRHIDTDRQGAVKKGTEYVRICKPLGRSRLNRRERRRHTGWILGGGVSDYVNAANAHPHSEKVHQNMQQEFFVHQTWTCKTKCILLTTASLGILQTG